MSDVPTLIKVIKYLRNSASPVTYENIIISIQKEQGEVGKALGKLVAHGIVDKRDGYYCYSANAKAEEFCQKLFAVYDKILGKSQMELLIRGLLSRGGGNHLLRMKTLLHVLMKEGFAIDDIEQMLDEETTAGHIKRIQIVFIRTVPSSSSPVFIPVSVATRLQRVNATEHERIKKQCHNSGLSSIEEDYLLGTYSPEQAESGVRHINTEKQQSVTCVLREETSRQAVKVGAMTWLAGVQDSKPYPLELSEIINDVAKGGTYSYVRTNHSTSTDSTSTK